MEITDFLLFLILTTLITYLFIPWKGIEKGSHIKIGLQFFMWFIILTVIVFILLQAKIII